MAQWTLQLGGRADVDLDTDGVITKRHSPRTHKANEAQLIESLREVARLHGATYAVLCTEHHGAVDLLAE